MEYIKNPTMFDEIRNIQFDFSHFHMAILDQSWKCDPFTSYSNLFYLIEEGEAELWCNGEHITMTAGNIYVITTKTALNFACKKHCKKMYFCGRLLDSDKNEIPLAPSGCIILQGRTEIIKKMIAQYQYTDYCSIYELKLMAEQLILEVMQNYGGKAEVKNYSEMIQRVIHIISQKPCLTHSAGTLAPQVSVSVGTLRNRFTAEAGMSLGKYVRKTTINAVEASLFNKDLSLDEIAEKYGFCDRSHLTRLFTAQFGISPTKYRKEHII